jgi:hypothetical protein
MTWKRYNSTIITSGTPSNHRITPRTMMLLLLHSGDNRLNNRCTTSLAISLPSTAAARHDSPRAATGRQDSSNAHTSVYQNESVENQNDILNQNELFMRAISADAVRRVEGVCSPREVCATAVGSPDVPGARWRFVIYQVRGRRRVRRWLRAMSVADEPAQEGKA